MGNYNIQKYSNTWLRFHSREQILRRILFNFRKKFLGKWINSRPKLRMTKLARYYSPLSKNRFCIWQHFDDTYNHVMEMQNTRYLWLEMTIRPKIHINKFEDEEINSMVFFIHRHLFLQYNFFIVQDGKQILKMRSSGRGALMPKFYEAYSTATSSPVL